MRVNLSEDIINKALNESINEFIIEEGKWGSKFKKAWNGIKNAAAIYMDARTNGRWNQKYGIAPNYGTPNSYSVMGRTKELYVLANWLQFHGQRLWSRLYNKDVDMHNGFNDRYDVNGQEYIEKYVTVESFNSYFYRYFRTMLPSKHPMCLYIESIHSMSHNPYEAVQKLNINSFLKDPQGDSYMNMKKGDKIENNQQETDQEEEGKKQQSEELSKIKELIPEYQEWVLTVKLNKQTIGMIENNPYLPNIFKNWLINLIWRYHVKGNDYISELITYDNFIDAYRDYYKNVL